MKTAQRAYSAQNNMLDKTNTGEIYKKERKGERKKEYGERDKSVGGSTVGRKRKEKNERQSAKDRNKKH